jgi:hypothetical protein
MAEACLKPITRATDILLGALGYDGDAVITRIELTASGYKGTARWDDGEEFEFESSDGPAGELEKWAVTQIKQQLN